ncbi:Peptidase M23 family protein [Rickettsiales endosymbiont of Paramecium tredecaurelia]|uniref:M23 family metallopeptidase n=1 Tax=Candidatus Sarmatiella mevalonica TaxID=2770581 RepID=UPI001921E7AC|nr:M23 family metallopeptidase [Candidatus Sarmatiella mevalonica]MBL3285151.1 Peptidase M23 family protein [Candidatus Sarmatiella mevalonica]
MTNAMHKVYRFLHKSGRAIERAYRPFILFANSAVVASAIRLANAPLNIKTYLWFTLLAANVLVWHKHLISLYHPKGYNKEFDEHCVTLYAPNKADLAHYLSQHGLTKAQMSAITSRSEFKAIKAGDRIDLIRQTSHKGSEVVAQVVLHTGTSRQIDLLKFDKKRSVAGAARSASASTQKQKNSATSKVFVNHSVKIGDSLAIAFRKMGLSKATAADLLNTYASCVDLKKISHDDSVAVILEKTVKDGAVINGQGKVIYACLNTQNKQYKLYSFQERGGFFFEDGKCATSFLLSNPLKTGSFSSGFGYRKIHANARSRMHTGVDYSAPAGTPIHAAADGVVTACGWHGAYGNAIEIKHKNGISTFYAHAKSVAKNLRVGSKVERGGVIAYVGMTGRATGNHLHFEVKVRGKHVDPIKAKRMYTDALHGKDFVNFKRTKEKINALQTNLVENKYAKL